MSDNRAGCPECGGVGNVHKEDCAIYLRWNPRCSACGGTPDDVPGYRCYGPQTHKNQEG